MMNQTIIQQFIVLCFVYLKFLLCVTNESLPTSLTLGLLAPNNLLNTNSLSGGHAALFAAKMAIREINKRSDILPNTTLSLVWNDTESDVGLGSIIAFWQCSIARVIGIIGEQSSIISEVI